MKKWIIFLSVSCAICIIVLGFFFKFLHNSIHSYTVYKNVFAEYETENAHEMLIEQGKEIALISVLSFLMLALLSFNGFMLISIALKRVTPLSIKENLASWKEHRAQKQTERKQAKLEKARAKVEQLQEELQKDDE